MLSCDSLICNSFYADAVLCDNITAFTTGGTVPPPSDPVYPLGVELRFSSTEMSYLADIYYSKYLEARSDGLYDVICAQFFFPNNYAIGFGWELDPTNATLGYHQYDVEYVLIYYPHSSTIPSKVFFSCHGLTEGNWMPYSQCEFNNSKVVTYCARNSHANYPSPGLKKRILGFANDVCASDGGSKAFLWSGMLPAENINYGTCQVYAGPRPSPPNVTLTVDQRWSVSR